MTAPYFDTAIPLGQRQFYPFTRESLVAIEARIADRDARRKTSVQSSHQVGLDQSRLVT